MALFEKTTKEAAAKTRLADASAKRAPKAVRKPLVQTVKAQRGSLERIIRAPWLSEKALIATEKNVYVFEVPADATATDVKDAIELIYKVRPVKVNMVNLPGKKVSLRTRRGTGTRASRHKAYVYLKKGDTISFA